MAHTGTLMQIAQTQSSERTYPVGNTVEANKDVDEMHLKILSV